MRFFLAMGAFGFGFCVAGGLVDDRVMKPLSAYTFGFAVMAIAGIGSFWLAVRYFAKQRWKQPPD